MFKIELELTVGHLLFFSQDLQSIDIIRAASFVGVSIVLGLIDMKRLKAEQTLQKAHDYLIYAQSKIIHAEKMQIIGRLASIIVHEVKNPLAVTMEGVGYLKRKIPKEDKKIEKTLMYITDSIKRADSIIKSLLDFSRLSKLDAKHCDLNLVVKNTVSEHHHLLEKHRIHLEAGYDNALPNVMLDMEKAKQILQNIIMNAVSVMPNGGILTIKSYQEGNHAVLEITDTGTGIDEEIIHKIYDPFFTTKSNQGGTGLGLWVSQHLIELHGGNITITNRKEGGVSVKIALPIN